MNRDEAMRIFDQHAVLVGQRDVIPVSTAKAITGVIPEGPLFDGGIDFDSFWYDGIHIDYLTLRGFLMAVTIMNVKLFHKQCPVDAA